MGQLVYTVKGKRGTLADLCAYFRVVPLVTARKRINQHGWDVEKAVTTSSKKKGKDFSYTSSGG